VAIFPVPIRAVSGNKAGTGDHFLTGDIVPKLLSHGSYGFVVSALG